MNFDALKLKIASPEEILSWSYGEVLKAETINYRSQRPEKDGLFSERIFGPTKDYECYCGKYRRIRYKGIICDRCGVEVTRASVRRERMGHIKLATPVAHIWFLRTIPSKIGLFLNTPLQKLEKVIYYAAYIVTKVSEENKRQALEELEREFKSRKKTNKTENSSEELKSAMLETREKLFSLKPGKILTEIEYFNLARRFANVFEASSGAEAVRKILENIDLKKEAGKIEQELKQIKDITRERYLLYRLKLMRSFIKNNMRPEWMILTVLPVMPPDLRPMVALDGGRYATSDLNDLYRRVINRNNRLKKLMELRAPEIIITNEKRMLQEAIDALIDNTARFGSQQQLSSQRRPLRSLADMLKGKQGRFRQNLLGKRVDYSGRSVIVVGPNLRLNECGIPKKMALELFKPFVINKIIERGMAHNIRNANHLIETASPEIWAILEEVIADRKVLLNRAPTLHRLGIQAFKPILIEDLCIRIPPMVCSAFNADFDGDQMAVHLPLTKEAQEEAVDLMLSSNNILKPATGEPIIAPSQDIVLGCYYLTKIKEEKKDLSDGRKEKFFSSPQEAILAYDFGYIKINEPIKVKIDKKVEADKGEAVSEKRKGFIETSVGRLIFNSVLPQDIDFINKTLNKKELQKFITELIEKYKLQEIWQILDKIKKLGFNYATLSGISWGMDDLVIPPEKKKILKDAEAEIALIRKQYQDGLLTSSECRIKTIEIWEKVVSEVAKKVPQYLDPYGSVFSIIDSGARGGWSQPAQMAGMKGLVQNPKGETIELPIRASYKEGLNVLEFFISTHGARKGLIDTALKTASAGYLTRRLVDVAQDLVIKENDCGTKEGIEIRRSEGESFGYNFSQRLFSRTAAEDIKIGKKIIVRANEVITRKTAEIIEKSDIQSAKIRSPITCKTLYGICSKCYGTDLGRNEPVKLGEAVGIVAAQSIGEPGTQLTLRTFHTGGVAGVDITHGLPRVQELFEIRIPKGKAALAEFDGVIENIEERGALKIIKLKVSKTGNKKSQKNKIIEYAIPRTNIIFVKPKQVVEKGDQISEGSIDLKQLFELKGREAVERYIINEVQKIYVSEGTTINDKHIEIIIKKMFSRVMIKDSGQTDFIIGEIIEKSKFLKANREAKRKKKEPAKAKQLLTGITKTALSTESWLSAASFQEAARVLVMAAAEGRVDNLRGLKENVIIGRLIPAGTGFHKTKSDDGI